MYIKLSGPVMADVWKTRFLLSVVVVIGVVTTEDLISMSTTLHGQLTLLCMVEDIQDTTVSWSFILPDGVEKNVAMGLQNLDPTFEILNPTPHNRNLKLTYLTEDRVGIYTCKSESKFGKTTVEARYNVSIAAEKTNDDIRPATIVVNTQIGKVEELTCIVKKQSPDTDTMSWYKQSENGEMKLSENELSFITPVTVKHSDDQWSLTVNIVNASSGGRYICRAGQIEYALYDIKVEEPPYILKKPMYTKSADLPCIFTEQIRPSDLYKIRWKTNENQYITTGTVNKRKYDLTITTFETILTVKNVYPSRSDGIYQVFLGNQPMKNCIFKVEVQKEPSVDKTQSSPSLTFNEGETANLTCIMNGRPTPNITWGRKRRIKNPELESNIFELDSDISNNSTLRHRFGKTNQLQVEGPTLIILNVSRYAADEYICIGSNVIDGTTYDDRWSISVKVNFGPEIQLFEREVSINNNQDVKLHCLVQAGKRPTTNWYNAETGDMIGSNFLYHPEDLEVLKGYSAYMMTLSLLVKQSVGHVFNVGYVCKAEVDGIVTQRTIIVRDNRRSGGKDSDVHVVPYNESATR